MTTEPQAQTSERVPDLRNMQEASPAETLAFLRERIRADAEKIRALEADAARYRYLRTCDRNPNEPHIVYFDGEEWRIFIEVADEMIDAAIAATQSPRSEAGEGKK